MAVHRWTGLKFLLICGLVAVAIVEICCGLRLIWRLRRLRHSMEFVGEERMLKAMNIPPLTVGDLLIEKLAAAQSQIPSMASQIAIRSMVRYFSERFTPINILIRQYDELSPKPQTSENEGQPPILTHTIESMKAMWRRVMAETRPADLTQLEQLNLPLMYIISYLQDFAIATITIIFVSWTLIQSVRAYEPHHPRRSLPVSSTPDTAQNSSSASQSSY